MTMDANKTPPNWRRPEDVMKLYKLRLKKRSLDFRMSDSSKIAAEQSCEKSTKASFKKNPFKRFEANPNECKRTKFNAETVDDPTADGTLFRLLNFSEPYQPSPPIDAQNLSFTNALSALTSPPGVKKDEDQKCKSEESDVFVDWTLRVKVRLMSTQPYPWNQRLKTCEEASGITGYVRCIDTDTENGRINLDTSFNARFHQCCLVWQHPSIPWLDVYPRIGRKSSGSSVISVASIKDKLYKNWLDSFRSLFQLVRAKQCPYFYMITNTFVCLFRAAGLNGYSEINASVSPTTRGFRQLLKDEDIEFTMPLKSGDHKSPVMNTCSDTGYESVDAKEESEDDEVESNPIDDEETDSWLQSMGMAEDDIKKLNATQVESVMGRERLIDESPESLVFVEGVEAQALFNFLVNCKSITATSGSFAGVPPTLLSPVAFTGATLTPLKVRESEIRQNDACYHSMEITGPLLPHTIHNLCDLMKNANLEKFTLTFANVEPSKPFTRATSYHIGTSTASSPVKTPRTPSAFDQQNLSDCGLKPKILSRFCRTEVRQYDSIKYSDSHYSCS